MVVLDKQDKVLRPAKVRQGSKGGLYLFGLDLVYISHVDLPLKRARV
jgi:hypothetical protein